MNWEQWSKPSVIDCGSNLLASQAPVNEFLGELVFMARDESTAVNALALCSTNAPGTGRLAQAMITSYGDYATISVIRNNADGSGAFCRELGSIGIMSADFPHIQGGIMAARLADERPLLTALSDPKESFNRAMGLYAGSVANFLREPQIVAIMGIEAAAPIEILSELAPKLTHFTVRELRAATDAALEANERVAFLQQKLRAVARTARADLLSIGQAALQLVDGEESYGRIVG